jgi:hypothetical protein
MKLARIFSSAAFLASATFGVAATHDETVSFPFIVHRRRSGDFLSRIKLLRECASRRQRFLQLVVFVLCRLLFAALSAFWELFDYCSTIHIDSCRHPLYCLYSSRSPFASFVHHRKDLGAMVLIRLEMAVALPMVRQETNVNDECF